MTHPTPDTNHRSLFRTLSHLDRKQRAPRPRQWPKRLLLTAEVLLLLLIFAALITTLTMRHAMRASLSQLDGNLPLAGLTAPVTVTRDPQGVPSIHATSLDDLLFAQGFVTAQDRLFQMDALRRHGAGELAEILGPSLLDHDRQQRTLQLRATADRALAILAPDQLHQLEAYARGVNAFLATHAETLPVEFHLLHYTPAPWSPRDSLLIGLVMSQDLSTEFPDKLNREALSAHLPADLLADLYPVGSWRDRPPTQTPPDLTTPTTEVEQIPLDRSQSLATPGDLLHLYNALRSNHCDNCRSGSNNWVVAGSRSASGAPLLSNDMHLGLTAPDIWYEAALHTTGASPLDVAGFTLPGVPFVIAGHNANVAWGFTNTGADVQDVLIEHLRGTGQNTEFELPNGTWTLAQHHTERIRVRFGRDVNLDVLTTTHALGATTIPTPIISPLYKSEHRSLALAWNIYDPTIDTLPFYEINAAPDAASLVAAFAAFGGPAENLVYADAHHIGFHALGRIPIRGPAIQRPRAVQPFVMPDTVPGEDEQDETGALHLPRTSPIPGLTQASYDLGSAKTQNSKTRNSKLNRPHPASSATFASFHSDLRVRLCSSCEPTLQKAQNSIAQNSKLNETRFSLPTNPTLFNTSYRRPPGRRRRPTQQTQPPPAPADIPTPPTTAYTIGNPISPIPVDALDPNQVWSGYIPYSALPSVLDPTGGILATANARITTENYPYFLANDWTDPYRVERINKLLSERTGLTPADMLAIQTDVHSEFDLVLAQRLAYAIDHASPQALGSNATRLHQAADILRHWDGDVSATSAAAAIAYATHAELWPMLLTAQITAHDAGKKSRRNTASLIALYTWGEKTSALEDLLQHTPARWLPSTYANWDDFLAAAVTNALNHPLSGQPAPGNLATWRFGQIHPVEIAHPIFGSTGLISKLLGLRTGTGPQPTGGDGTTIKQAGLHFGPSERLTVDLSNPETTQANITTGESGNPASTFYLDQFQSWLHGTTFTLPLTHPTATHTLTLSPQ
jgi:acyl-homoserine lactone acylase PvdQ